MQPTQIWKTIPFQTQERQNVREYSDIIYDLYYANPYHKHFSEEEIEFFADYIQDTPALEIGSEIGRVSLPLLRRGCHLFGIECCSSMFQFLEKKLNSVQRQRFLCWNLQKFPYPIHDQTFASIIIPFGMFAFAHKNIQDSGANLMMHELYRIMQSKGTLIISDWRTSVFNRHHINQYSRVCELFHTHAEHGNIKEERIYQYDLEENRIFEQQIILTRKTRFIRLQDNTLLEEDQFHCPIWDAENYRILGNDAGFNYIKGVTVDFYEKPTIMHIFEKN